MRRQRLCASHGSHFAPGYLTKKDLTDALHNVDIELTDVGFFVSAFLALRRSGMLTPFPPPPQDAIEAIMTELNVSNKSRIDFKTFSELVKKANVRK